MLAPPSLLTLSFPLLSFPPLPSSLPPFLSSSLPPLLLLPSPTYRTALQALYKATEQARKYNHYVGGVSHTWIQYYQTMLTDDWAILTEW